MEDKKVLLSVRDLHVKFRVRGRILSAIRGVSLDLYENESIAIVGESGSGKSVFTKTFAGMLETNGFVSQGQLLYNDDELAETNVNLRFFDKSVISSTKKKLDKYAKLELGADIYKKIIELDAENKARYALTDKEDAEIAKKIDELVYKRTELGNLKQTIDPSKEKVRLKEVKAQIAAMTEKINELEKEKSRLLTEHKIAAKSDSVYNAKYAESKKALTKEYQAAIKGTISEKTAARNELIA